MNPNERQIISAMEREWPRWQIWTVHKSDGPTSWNARLWDDGKRLLHAGSPAELAEYLEEAESGEMAD
jgi:hypothetical protein